MFPHSQDRDRFVVFVEKFVVCGVVGHDKPETDCDADAKDPPDNKEPSISEVKQLAKTDIRRKGAFSYLQPARPALPFNCNKP
jgi:hypothetical protein